MAMSQQCSLEIQTKWSEVEKVHSHCFSVYVLVMQNIKAFVFEAGCFHFVSRTVKPKIKVLDISWACCARSTGLVLHIFELSAV